MSAKMPLTAEMWAEIWKQPNGVCAAELHASYDAAVEAAKNTAKNATGGIGIVLRAVAIVRPPAVQAPVVERLAGAPRKRSAGPDAAVVAFAAHAIHREAQASVTLDTGDGETHSVDEAHGLTEEPAPAATCPLCAAGSAPARGFHTDAKGKRHRCPDAKAKGAQ